MLRQTALFGQLSDRDLLLIAELARPIHFDAGTAATSEGDEGGRFYLITEGVARVEVGGQLQGVAAGVAAGRLCVRRDRLAQWWPSRGDRHRRDARGWIVDSSLEPSPAAP